MKYLKYLEGMKGVIGRAAMGTAALVLLTSALLAFATHAQATPALAKGKPCSTCHSGSPPSKGNVKH